MPKFEDTLVYPRPLPEVFDFFRRTANLIVITPPELHMRLVEAPDLIELGSRIVLQGRRWGVPQRLVSEIVAFDLNRQFVDEQKEGPFRWWRHTHAFAASPDGTEVTDLVEFEPPGGLLGLVVTASFVERDLKWIFGYRNEKLKELLGAGERRR